MDHPIDTPDSDTQMSDASIHSGTSTGSDVSTNSSGMTDDTIVPVPVVAKRHTMRIKKIFPVAHSIYGLVVVFSVEITSSNLCFFS
jgi:hypothetical protein